MTDNWVTSQHVLLDSEWICRILRLQMGYDSVSTSPLGDNSTFEASNMGDNVIEIAIDERDRMVRWQDGAGVFTKRVRVLSRFVNSMG